jgi:hypothetical protein
MKRIFMLFILFIVAGQIMYSQDLWRRKRYEAYVGFGPSQFFGDVGGFTPKKNILGFKDLSFRQTRFDVNLGLKYRIYEDLSVRLSFAYGMLHATDERGSNETRDYEARTTIFEPAIIAEYSFIKSNNENSFLFQRGRSGSRGSFLSSIDIFAFGGIGGVSFKVEGNDALIDRGMVNSGFSAVIPLGVGASLLINPDFNLGFEIGGRYCFSDYLDGFTSQYSSSNDVYYFVNFTFTYKILTGSNGLPEFLNFNRNRRRF